MNRNGRQKRARKALADVKVASPRRCRVPMRPYAAFVLYFSLVGLLIGLGEACSPEAIGFLGIGSILKDTVLGFFFGVILAHAINLLVDILLYAFYGRRWMEVKWQNVTSWLK